jgi:serine/threonine-protein kinase
MALSAGSHLGPYEVLAAIGAGGMGEVYRARDRKLDRDVALKILPEALAADPDRIARFEREAKTLAALNQPHIAQIYGLEESNGVRALVMELVDGPTLADRLAQGPIPLDEALPMAKQIAEALEAAHEQGIIHRDLKPANLKVRADGTVKVLDFGLAKAFDSAATAGPGATMSPTLSIHATQAGIILGTAAYMAPEQARGKAVDKRADIWAFGCVLFEMLTAQRAFAGDDISTTLASVLKTDPDWHALPFTTPPSLRRLLGRCLRKEPKERLRDIGEARIAIDDMQSGVVADAAAPIVTISRTPRWRRVAIPVTTGLVMSLATAGLVWVAARSPVAPRRVSRLEITTPSASALVISGGAVRDLAISPDGSRLIYIGANGVLFVRPLDQLDSTPLVRTAAPRDPFVSPDGQWVGFADENTTLKKVPITGGPALPVVKLNSSSRGATWAPDGTIIFATGAPGAGLQRVSASGGESVVLTRPEPSRGEARHQWPEILPGGQAVLFTITASAGGLDAASIAVLDLRTGRKTILLRGGSDAHYVSSGYLVYAAAGALRAVRFDIARLIVMGTSIPVVPQVLTTTTGAVDAVMANDGTLVYVSASTGGGVGRTLVWVNRQGDETPIGAPPRAYITPRVSPDGTHVAVDAFDQQLDIWLWRLPGGPLTPVTFDPGFDASPVWASNSSRLFFSSSRSGRPVNLFTVAVDRTGDVVRLTESPNRQFASAITPDGRRLVFSEQFPNTGEDVMEVEVDGHHQITPLVQTPNDERNGMVSPDGRWLAYEANDSGAFQIYVRPYPNVNTGRWQVSTGGGTRPLWAHRLQELFYLAPNGALMRVAVPSGATWTVTTPTKLLEGRYWAGAGAQFGRPYDIAPDDQRFLMLTAGGTDPTGAAPHFEVVQHFDEELKRLVPTK